MKKPKETHLSKKDNTLFVIPILIAGILLVVLIFTSVKNSIKPLVQYQGAEDIVIKEQTLKGIALIEEKKTFTKDNIPHVQFGIDIIQRQDNYDKYLSLETSYILTQKELDAIVGEENDAFDYEEYNISYSAVIQKDNVLGQQVDDFAYEHDMEDRGMFTQNLHCNDYLKMEGIEDAEVSYDKDDSSLTLHLKIKPRVNFLGGTEFTKEEKEKHKEMVNAMCHDILRMLNKEKPQFIWEAD